MIIRKARLADVEQLVEMGRNFHKEAGWLDIVEWNNHAADIALASMVDSKDSVILVVENGGDELIGMIAAVICPMWFNKSVLTAQEWFWYVKPENRGGVGIKLFKKLEDMLRQKGVEVLTMISVKEMPSIDGIYIKLGFRQSEQNWIKRL